MGSGFSTCTVEDTIHPSSSYGSNNPQPETAPTSDWNTNLEKAHLINDTSSTSSTPTPRIKTTANPNSGYSYRNTTNYTTSIRFQLPFTVRMRRREYFRNYTTGKGLLYAVAIIYVVACSTVSILQPMIYNCEQVALETDFENPGYAFAQKCHHQRQMNLLFLTPEDCAFGRRIVFATIFGALIGWERRQADRPAGIRTMAVVSLGSCLFAICGTFAFIEGPMGWDASRISAAIPSGVGFLGAGIIWKQTDKDTNSQSVHGLTTAASLWLSAAVGIACSGEMYFAASFAIAVMMILLRFGPRILFGQDTADFSSEREYDEESNESSLQSADYLPSDLTKGGYGSYRSVEKYDSVRPTSPTPLSPTTSKESSTNRSSPRRTRKHGGLSRPHSVPSILE